MKKTEEKKEVFERIPLKGKFLIKKARILDPSLQVDFLGDVFIEDGRLLGFEENIEVTEEAVQILNGKGLWFFPGLVDIHVHLRDPGEEWKEDIETGTRAALAGGVLRVACMPNTKPPNDSVEVTQYILKKARERGFVKVYPVAAITKGQKGEELVEVLRLLEAGAKSFSDDGKWVKNSFLMREILKYSKTFNFYVISHCEDETLSQNGQINKGYYSAKLGFKGIPPSAEAVAVARDIILAKETRGNLHIAHVSCKETVKIIELAKKEGISLSAETCPHYFTLTEKETDGYNTLAKVNPPLRKDEDVEAIKEALKEGIINVIASDHAPHSPLEKNLEFEKAAPGMIGLQTLLPLSYKLVEEGILSPIKLLEYLITNPSKILGINPPSLRKGAPVEAVLFSPEETFVLTSEKILSKSKNTPFLNRTLKGKVKGVFKDGIFYKIL